MTSGEHYAEPHSPSLPLLSLPLSARYSQHEELSKTCSVISVTRGNSLLPTIDRLVASTGETTVRATLSLGPIFRARLPLHSTTLGGSQGEIFHLKVLVLFMMVTFRGNNRSCLFDSRWRCGIGRLNRRFSILKTHYLPSTNCCN